ncbi:MAG: hypothetical protein Q8M83_06435 [bacterium]|nr:hypothetical protein [bacterium]
MAQNALNKRKNELFGLIVREYIASADPIGSEFLRQKYHLDLSPATIRNEMAELTELGLLNKPHTSAGRIPTEAGYRYFIANCLEERDNEKFFDVIQSFLATPSDVEKKIKRLAKEMADMLQSGVFVSLNTEETYYTGLGYLFSQPEFQSYDLVCDLSAVLDKLDDVMGEMMNKRINDLEILLGQENPFGPACATLLLPYRQEDNVSGIFGVFGPMRMDYEKTVPLMKEIKKILKSCVNQ